MGRRKNLVDIESGVTPGKDFLNFFMNIEILFKNGIFLSLFLSMISFWTENIVFNTSSKKEADPENIRLLSLTEQGRWQVGFNLSEKLFFISFVLITLELLYRWFLSGHPPLSNLYESLLFLIWGLIGFFLFVYTKKTNNKASNATLISDQKSSKFVKSANTEIENNVLLKISFVSNRPAKQVDLGSSTESSGEPEDGNTEQGRTETISPRNFVGCILSSTALFIQTFADWRLPSEMRDIKPLIPALQSNWLLMHVSIMILSYAALLIGSIIAITYIIIFLQSNKVVNKPVNIISNRGLAGTQSVKSLSLPNSVFLEELDSLSYRILAFGFPLLTLGILSGSVWANEAWGSYWSWDPKETWAFITWLIFAFYLHTRLQYGWEGEKSAFVASFGFFIVWICYLGVNLLGKGLHSYGWLS